MFWLSRAHRAGDNPDGGRRLANRRALISVLVVGLVAPVSACGAWGPREADDSVVGAEWKTAVRRSSGAATDASPAELTGVSVQKHDHYDRLVFAFDGSRPGYRVGYSQKRVAYSDSLSEGPVLHVALFHIESIAERHLTPRLAAVRDVVQRRAAEMIVETTVAPAVGDENTRLPFRVGLDVGEFYVDIAHPDEAAARPA